MLAVGDTVCVEGEDRSCGDDGALSATGELCTSFETDLRITELRVDVDDAGGVYALYPTVKIKNIGAVKLESETRCELEFNESDGGRDTLTERIARLGLEPGQEIEASLQVPVGRGSMMITGEVEYVCTSEAESEGAELLGNSAKASYAY